MGNIQFERVQKECKSAKKWSRVQECKSARVQLSKNSIKYKFYYFISKTQPILGRVQRPMSEECKSATKSARFLACICTLALLHS